MSKNNPEKSPVIELLVSGRAITLGSGCCEHNVNAKYVKNNSSTFERCRVPSGNIIIGRFKIDKQHTYQHAIDAVAAHYEIPEDLRDDFGKAIAALAKDAISPTPHLLPMVLSKTKDEAPSTKVTQISPVTSNDFPETAPEKWTPHGRGYKYQKGDETPEAFAVRVYGQWMRPDEPHRSIGMPEILHLDEPLWNALRRSLRDEKPKGFCLPSKKERNDAQIAEMKLGSAGDLSAKEWWRLKAAENYRRHK